MLNMSIYSLWDIHSLTIVIVLLLIKGVSMSGVSRGGNSYNKLWDIKKESREIFILYNFLEPDEYSFIDILKNKHKCIDSLERVKNPAGCIMGTALENVCSNFAYYIESIESNEKINL